MSAIQPLPRRSHRRVLLPTALLLVLALAWSAAWVYLRDRTDRMLTRAMADQAAQGRTLTCQDRSLGGYPFRLELRCRDARLEVARDKSRVVATAPALLVVAQVYDPRHLILELTGPMAVATPDDGRSAVVTWRTAEASLVTGDGPPERGDLVLDGLSATLDADPAPVLGDAHLDFHARRAAGQDPDAESAGTPNQGAGDRSAGDRIALSDSAYDVVARLDAASIPALDASLGGTQPVKAEFQGTVTHLGAFGPAPLPDRLKTWAEQGGAMQVVLARLDRGPSALRAQGEVSLDRQGRPSGQLTVALAGVQELGGGLKRAGVDTGNLLSLLGFGLQVLGKPTNIDGRPAAEVPITLAGGRARAGAFPLGKLPSLF